MNNESGAGLKMLQAHNPETVAGDRYRKVGHGCFLGLDDQKQGRA